MKDAANKLKYAAQKGFCEDLDEGKFSLPIIFTLAHTTNRVLLRSLLQQRKCNGRLSFEQKTLLLDIIRAAEGLECTLRLLRLLYDEIQKLVVGLEGLFGMENNQLRELLVSLKM